MSDLSMGFDLSMLRKDGEVLAGFHVSNGVYQMTVEHPQTGERVQGQMPVLDFNLVFANGRKERISVTPDSIMAMIAVLSEWSVKLSQTTQQVAPPPAPPNTQGRGPGQ
jgi:hypothetical protein